MRFRLFRRNGAEEWDDSGGNQHTEEQTTGKPASPSSPSSAPERKQSGPQRGSSLLYAMRRGQPRLWCHCRPNPRRLTLAVGAALGWTSILLLHHLFLHHHYHHDYYYYLRAYIPSLFLPSPSTRLSAVQFPDHFWLDWEARGYFTPRDTLLSPLSGLRFLPKEDCQGSTFLLVLVSSPLKDLSTRRLIRNTWGGAVKSGHWPRATVPVNVEVFFVLGASSEHTSSYLETLETQVRAEAEQYDDLIVGDFVDTYRNLSRKTLTGLQWAWRHCPHSQFVMKVDQDTLVDFPRVTDYLLHHGSELRGSVLGKLYFNSKRRDQGKWKVLPEEYPLSLYPTFAGGPCYLLSGDVVAGIVNVSQYFPTFVMEDVHVTGILARVLGVRRLHVQQLQNWKGDSLCSLLLEEGEGEAADRGGGYQVSMTALSFKELGRAWRMLVDGRCDNSGDGSNT